MMQFVCIAAPIAAVIALLWPSSAEWIDMIACACVSAFVGWLVAVSLLSLISMAMATADLQ